MVGKCSVWLNSPYHHAGIDNKLPYPHSNGNGECQQKATHMIRIDEAIIDLPMCPYHKLVADYIRDHNFQPSQTYAWNNTPISIKHIEEIK